MKTNRFLLPRGIPFFTASKEHIQAVGGYFWSVEPCKYMSPWSSVLAVKPRVLTAEGVVDFRILEELCLWVLVRCCMK